MPSLFLSPFLLFILELMVGKAFLIQFGGSSSAWLALMLFFTIMLLLGYIYATLTNPKTHAILIALTCLLVLISLVSQGTLFPTHFAITDPTISLLLNAGLTLSLPTIILASASSLLPLWLNTTQPYRYYSLSNAGSLLSLLAYPLLIEPNLTFHIQQIFWFILFLINGMLTIKIIKKHNPPLHTTPNPPHTIPPHSFVIIFYSLISTAFFLLTTTTLSQMIGPFPLLWALPLAIYLLSFIITFSYPQAIQLSFHLPITLLLIIATIAIIRGRLHLGMISTEYIVLLLTQLFVNLIFHTKVYQLRPPKTMLRPYYVAIGLGSVLASLLMSVVAPLVFSEFHELPILLAFCCLVLVALAFSEFKQKIIFVQFVIVTILGLGWIWQLYVPNSPSSPNLSANQIRSRNFYGFLNLVEFNNNNQLVERRLLSGKTIHGTQVYLPSSAALEPTTYYSRETALGPLFAHPIQNVGIIGLGVGTIAAYCDSGDNFTFYEINPDVITLSQSKFTYLSDCTKRGGHISLIQGDGRISLKKEVGNTFDLLVIDAFTDDAIPFHLLTKEAVSLYLSHLTDTGIIALHITSKYLDLKPTLVNTAATLNLYTNSHHSTEALYLLLSRKPLTIGNPESAAMHPNLKPWTDDYTNILQTIKW